MLGILLQVWGVLMGLANETFASWPVLGGGISLWNNMDPELLLTVFLPILLFAGSFVLDWHTLRRIKWSALLLAGENT